MRKTPQEFEICRPCLIKLDMLFRMELELFRSDHWKVTFFGKCLFYIIFWLITFEAMELRRKIYIFGRSQRDAPTHKISCRSEVIKK